MPIFIGSGINPTNVGRFKKADGFIIGTFFKKEGKWQNELDEQRINSLLEAVERLKEESSI